MLTQLLNHIDSYLVLHSTLQDLEAWLVSNLQRILDSGEEATIGLANELDADLVQLGEGLIDELTFRERLQSYIRIKGTLPVEYYETQPQLTVDATTPREVRLQHAFV